MKRSIRSRAQLGAILALNVAACGHGGGSIPAAPSVDGGITHVQSFAAPAPEAALSPQIRLATGFTATVIAHVGGGREIAALPNGDLLVGTTGSTIAIVPAAEGIGTAGTVKTFAALNDSNASSVAYAPNGSVYAGTKFGVWRLGYRAGAQAASGITKIAAVRPGPFVANHDRDHSTTSLAVTATELFAGVGSDCDACVERDPTRAKILQMPLGGSSLTTKATRIRNPIALTISPVTGYLWAGGAGQDSAPYGHPYEFMDAAGAHTGLADYGWPSCYEDHSILPGAPATSCSGVAIPAIEFPAYSTAIGATFYPAAPAGAYAFPAAYRGGLFVTLHGSWHNASGSTLSYSQPRVAFVPFVNGRPAKTVNWANPSAQWIDFMSGFGTTSSNRIGRPTGVAVGPKGSLFVADDLSGNIYRIRPH